MEAHIELSVMRSSHTSPVKKIREVFNLYKTTLSVLTIWPRSLFILFSKTCNSFPVFSTLTQNFRVIFVYKQFCIMFDMPFGLMLIKMYQFTIFLTYTAL